MIRASLSGTSGFQHRTQLHYSNNGDPTLGWFERGWIEEESYGGPLDNDDDERTDPLV